MTRPEAVALFPVLCVAIGRERAARPQAARFALVFALVYGTYFAVRATHFGHFLPNTFYAKLDYGGALLLRRGLSYVAGFAAAAPVLSLAAFAALIPLRGAPVWIHTLGLAVGVQVAVVVYEGGDHLPLFRFLAPTLPLLALLALHAFARLGERPATTPWRQRLCIASGLAVLALSGVLAARAVSVSGDASELEAFVAEGERTRHWSDFGRYLRVAAPADAALGTIAIGAIGYQSQLHIVDPHGLVDVQVAHRDTELGGGLPGHEKFDVDDLLARRPDYLLVHNQLVAGHDRL